jgi:hypothetical protein
LPSLTWRGILPTHVSVPGVFPIPLYMQGLLSEVLTIIPLMACSQASLAAEVLFLRKQLAFYQERKDQAAPIRCCKAAVAAHLKVL